jgi:uroporphyrinogen-III synthase
VPFASSGSANADASPTGNIVDTLRRKTGDVLHGFTIGITADRRWDEQAALFERRGATIVHAPTIRTIPLGSDARLREVTEAVIARHPDVFIANTGLGVRSWFGAADSWDLGPQLLASLRSAAIFARGPKASGAVHSLGLEVVARAPSERLSEAVELAMPHLRPGSIVALQVDGSGCSPEIARLRATGVEVVVVPVYEWRMPEDARPAVKLANSVIAGRVQAVTFTTGPAIRNWMAIAAEHDCASELRSALTNGRVVVGVVGPVCADVASELGVASEHMVVPAAFRLGPLVRSVVDRLIDNKVAISLATGELELTGQSAVLNGEVVELSLIESRLLAALVKTPNAVFSKLDLSREVWGDETLDPHVVEVTIARLRRRLGFHGSAVASVHRRGYTLRT